MATKLTLQIGLVSVAARAHKATDEEASGFHAVCTGTTEKPHDPARVRQSVGCTSCDIKHSSVFPFTQRGKEEGDKIVVVTAEELAKAKGAPRKPNVDLAFHPREKVYAGTVAADSVQYLAPDKGAEKAYAALRNTLLSKPHLVAGTIWAPSTVNALWIIEAVDRHLVMSKRCWPETVRATPAIPDVDVPPAEQQMFDLLVDTLTTDFDVLVYVDESKKGVAELVAAKAEGASPLAAAPTTTAPVGDLMAALQASVKAATKKPTTRKAPAKKAAPRKAPAKKAVA